MSTTIINPAANTNSSTNSGVFFIIGILAFIAFAYIFVIYGFPLIKQGLSGFGSGGIHITLPSTLDVKVQQTK